MHEDQEDVAEEVEADGWPDEALFGGLFDVDGADPEGRRDERHDAIADHRATDYISQYQSEMTTQNQDSPIGMVHAYQNILVVRNSLAAR